MMGSACPLAFLGPKPLMWREHSVAVIVPAYNEQELIGRTLARLPSYVDTIFVVDDASVDDTATAVSTAGDHRVRYLRHSRNRGVGAAIATGYRHAAEAGLELLAVMAADDQMHPDDLGPLLDAVIDGRAEYSKGNRFVHPDRRRMPLGRRVAGKALAWLTRVTTGQPIDDSQCGYTVLDARAVRRLPLDELWPRYGYPNDLLGLLSAAGLSAVDVPVRPVYADETSGIRPWHAAVVAFVICRRFVINWGAGRGPLTLRAPWSAAPARGAASVHCSDAGACCSDRGATT